MSLRLGQLADARVAIWGYGREGRAALAALARYFPRKALSVFCTETEAREIVASGATTAPGAAAGIADGANVTVVTTPPDVEALSQFDVVIKSPGISPYKLPAAAALRAGVQFTSGSALWFAEHPHARTICVTGTKGKSTVTALIAHLLRKNGQRTALAGNIGMPLLDLLEPVQAPAWWAIELSSFQTHDFAGAPTVAVVNNLYEEHLDWHGTRERYAQDKLLIAARAQALVVNAQPELLDRSAAHARRFVFGAMAGWHVRDEAIWRDGVRALALADLPLVGPHNALNACAALAAVEAAGFDASALAAHVATFTPLPHRLQRLGARDGIDYVNDSIATTPYATIEALRSLPGPVTVLVGGFDRGLDWSPFVDYVRRSPPHAIVTMGANGAAISARLQGAGAAGCRVADAGALAEALDRARALSAAGTILLSPGAPSFDQFRDYAERGREFARLAGFDPAAITQIQGLGID